MTANQRHDYIKVTFIHLLPNTFQLSVALQHVQWQSQYPMDFYANDSLGPWTVNNDVHRPQRPRKQRTKIKIESKLTEIEHSAVRQGNETHSSVRLGTETCSCDTGSEKQTVTCCKDTKSCCAGQGKNSEPHVEVKNSYSGPGFNKT